MGPASRSRSTAAESASTPASGSKATRTSHEWLATSLSRMPNAVTSGTGSGRKPRSTVIDERCSGVSASTVSSQRALCSRKPSTCARGAEASQRAQIAWLSSAATVSPAAEAIGARPISAPLPRWE